MADDMDVDDTDATLANPETVDKYKTASNIANAVIARVIAGCVPGARVAELCAGGDRLIEEGVAKVYGKDKKMAKGIAFPTCVSPNHCVGHYCPPATDGLVLQDGDIVKVDLGVQIDGMIAVVGHTAVVSANPAIPVTGRKADVICAAHFAGEAALRLLRPGKTNHEVTEIIAKVAEAFKCTPVEGVVSHQMKRFVIDANKIIANKKVIEQPVDEFTFEEGEVYAIDILMSTGEGKASERDVRTGVFKRKVDQTYALKMKASRQLLNEVNKKFATVPFSTRNISLDEKVVKLGLTECLQHDMLQPYPVLFEKDGEFVAQVKFTALILPSSIDKITAHPPPNVSSALTIEDAKVKEVLALGTRRSKSKKNKKKKKGGNSDAMEE